MTVRGDQVFLRGDVTCEQRRAALAEVAGEIVPDLIVHNEVRVTAATETTDAEELR